MLAVVAVTVGLTPGVSVGVLSNPVAPLIVPPSTPRVAATTAAPVTTETPATTPPSTATSIKSAAPITAALTATTVVAAKVGSIRIAAGSAQQGRPVAIQASGFRPNEVVTFTISGRNLFAKADTRGQARILYTVARTATSLLVKVAANSGSRSASVAVRKATA